MDFKNWLEEIENGTYVSYTGVVLYPNSREKLINYVKEIIPEEWNITSDHMTINLKGASEGPAADFIGHDAEMTVSSIAQDQNVIAVQVETDVPSNNPVKHITIAVAPGATAQLSNNLDNWKPINPIKVQGAIKEVEQTSQPKKVKPYVPPKAPAPNDPREFVKSLKGKPLSVIGNAMKGKFPGISDQEINMYVS